MILIVICILVSKNDMYNIILVLSETISGFPVIPRVIAFEPSGETRGANVLRINCSICGYETGQEDKWTTSEPVIAQGKELEVGMLRRRVRHLVGAFKHGHPPRRKHFGGWLIRKPHGLRITPDGRGWIQSVGNLGQETWIQVQGADNISYCGCVAGALRCERGNEYCENGDRS